MRKRSWLGHKGSTFPWTTFLHKGVAWVIVGWFSNRTGMSFDDGARKSNNWLDQAWPMAEREIGNRKSSLVLFARFPVVKWRSRSVAKSAFIINPKPTTKATAVTGAGISFLGNSFLKKFSLHNRRFTSEAFYTCFALRAKCRVLLP